MKGIPDKTRNVRKLRDASYEASSGIENRLELTGVRGGKTNVHSIPKVYTSADQGMYQDSGSMG
jgi:hypothetical protein